MKVDFDLHEFPIRASGACCEDAFLLVTHVQKDAVSVFEMKKRASSTPTFYELCVNLDLGV